MHKIVIYYKEKDLDSYEYIVTKMTKFKNINWKVMQQPEKAAEKNYSGNFMDMV